VSFEENNLFLKELHFESGYPTKINNTSYGSLELVEKLNELGGENAIGRADLVENRLVGMKSRGVYETPGGTILYTAHQELENLCLDKDVARFKKMVSLRYADLVYNGQWYTPLREHLDEFVEDDRAALLAARIKDHQKDPEAAVPYLRRVLTFNPRNIEARSRLAACLRSLGQTAEAAGESEIHRRMVVQRGRSTPHRGRWYSAETRFRRVAGPLFEARMRTGVMHQIRVHAAFVGIPLLGDRIYGGGATPADAPGGVTFFLHHLGISGPEGLHTDSVPLPSWASPTPVPTFTELHWTPSCAGRQPTLAI